MAPRGGEIGHQARHGLPSPARQAGEITGEVAAMDLVELSHVARGRGWRRDGSRVMKMLPGVDRRATNPSSKIILRSVRKTNRGQALGSDDVVLKFEILVPFDKFLTRRARCTTRQRSAGNSTSHRSRSLTKPNVVARLDGKIRVHGDAATEFVDALGGSEGADGRQKTHGMRETAHHAESKRTSWSIFGRSTLTATTRPSPSGLVHLRHRCGAMGVGEISANTFSGGRPNHRVKYVARVSRRTARRCPCRTSSAKMMCGGQVGTRGHDLSDFDEVAPRLRRSPARQWPNHSWRAGFGLESGQKGQPTDRETEKGPREKREW